MEEINQQDLQNLQKIATTIEKEKNLKIINFHAGLGSFGRVVIAEDNKTKVQYAIKIISIFNGDDDVCPQKLENAKKEADFLKQCNHPNVVKFNYFIQMEKCKKNLEQWIIDQNNKKIPRHQFINFACQTLSAIQYIHNNQCLLRDLSLKNILIDRNNHIKICDFGFAKKILELSSNQFMTSSPKGAMFYFPPEVPNKKGFEQNYQGDIWAFGICFYILGGATYMDCLKMHTQEYKYIQSLDQDLNQILSRILSLSQDLRPTIQEIIQEFEILRNQTCNPEQASLIYTQFETIKSQDLNKALDLIQTCIEIQPNDMNYQSQQGYIQHELKFYDQAIKSYLKCIEISPKDSSCYFNLGNSFRKKGMRDEAIRSYKKCIEINPLHDVCYFYLGNAYSKKGMIDKAIQSYQKCIEINPKDDKYFYNLGIAYQNKGMVKEASNSFKECYKINPKRQEIQQNQQND